MGIWKEQIFVKNLEKRNHVKNHNRKLHISGIKMEAKEFKMVQYADDLTAFV